MISVVDAMCGAGKTSVMIERMRKGGLEGKKYLYITPFLTECEVRIPEALPEMEFCAPKNLGEGKLSSLARLVKEGRNISSTHTLFSMLTPSIVEDLIDQQYVLIIDEALSCVGMLNNLVHTDVRDLKTSKMVKVDSTNRGRVEWNEEDYPNHDGKYSEIRNLCNLGMVYGYADCFLFYEFPPRLISGLNEVYVLTYMFSGSDMRCWCDLNNIKYEYVRHDEWGLRSEEELKQVVRENLEILKPSKLLKKVQQVHCLSKTWYENASSEIIKEYKAMLRSCLVTNKAKAGDVFWTTFKPFQGKMGGAGYTRGVSEDMPAFLPLNMRATNDYADYWLCMYAVNMFYNPVLKGYLLSNGVQPDEEAYALSEMIQFIFRGSIRKGEPMKVLVLSNRMRSLLEGWMKM